MSESFIDEYRNARRAAKKEYAACVSKGENGYLNTLQGIINNTEIVSEITLDLVEIPLQKIVGTYSHSRSIAFSRSFMPLLDEDSEFAIKWCRLMDWHITEGISDPIQVYEYLNWFYVVEGNKRVSILKYMDGFSIAAKVIRLIPKKDDQAQDIRIYYEFMDFYSRNKINCIWFSKEGSFSELEKYLSEFVPPIDIERNKYFINSLYIPFRSIYHEVGGKKLELTTGDAFLEYIKIYGLPTEIDEKKLKPIIREFIKELEPENVKEHIGLAAASNVISKITNLVTPSKKLKIAFAYANTCRETNWSNAHEQGRQYIQRILGDYIETHYVEKMHGSGDSYDFIKELAQGDNDVIFTTCPTFANATLKAAIEFPNVKFLNCSGTRTYKHMSTYFGRVYEPRFLSGLVAGAMTESNIIGYVAAFPIPEIISGINAFALGVKMVNPRAVVKVIWTNMWDNYTHAREAALQLVRAGADVISQHQNSPAPQEVAQEYGVYSIGYICDMSKFAPDRFLTSVICNWGIFYEKLIRNILSGTWKVIFELLSSTPKLENFWWGMNAGVVDILPLSNIVPSDVKKLVALMKKSIIQNEFHPFTGPIYDQKKVLRIQEDEKADDDEILSMDWFVDNVEGNLPVSIDITLPQDMLIKSIITNG